MSRGKRAKSRDIERATDLPFNGVWKPGPANSGKDPLERGEIEVGDRFLVLAHGVDMTGTHEYWDARVIVAGETGWEDPSGHSWLAWDWSVVSWYIKLTSDTMPQLGTTTKGGAS